MFGMVFDPQLWIFEIAKYKKTSANSHKWWTIQSYDMFLQIWSFGEFAVSYKNSLLFYLFFSGFIPCRYCYEKFIPADVESMVLHGKTCKLKLKSDLFNCLMCQYKTNLKKSLERHIRWHTGEKPYKCTLCDYKAGRKDSLNLHWKLKHV